MKSIKNKSVLLCHSIEIIKIIIVFHFLVDSNAKLEHRIKMSIGNSSNVIVVVAGKHKMGTHSAQIIMDGRKQQHQQQQILTSILCVLFATSKLVKVVRWRDPSLSHPIQSDAC